MLGVKAQTWVWAITGNKRTRVWHRTYLTLSAAVGSAYEMIDLLTHVGASGKWRVGIVVNADAGHIEVLTCDPETSKWRPAPWIEADLADDWEDNDD